MWVRKRQPVIGMASNLPSSFSKGGAQPQQASAPLQASMPRASALQLGGEGSTALFLAILALLIAAASFYGVFFMDRPLSLGQKEAIRQIATDLRSLQNREITMSAPVQSTIYLNQSYPIREMFPGTFTIPLEFDIPVDTQLIGISATGQTVSFRVQESFPIKAAIPVSSARAFGNSTVRVYKEFPIEAKFASSIKVRAAYGKELNSVIDRLEQLAGEAPG